MKSKYDKTVLQSAFAITFMSEVQPVCPCNELVFDKSSKIVSYYRPRSSDEQFAKNNFAIISTQFPCI